MFTIEKKIEDHYQKIQQKLYHRNPHKPCYKFPGISVSRPDQQIAIRNADGKEQKKKKKVNWQKP